MKDGPVAHALIRKSLDAKANGTPLPCFSTGKPLRQMLFSDDFAKILVWALACYEDDKEPVNVAGAEVSIKELTEVCRGHRLGRAPEWSGEMDGLDAAACRHRADSGVVQEPHLLEGGADLMMQISGWSLGEVGWRCA